jgi:hypothetical protein
MPFLADHGDGSILVNLTNAVNSGVCGHPAADDEVFVMFHYHYSSFLDVRRAVMENSNDNIKKLESFRY